MSMWRRISHNNVLDNFTRLLNARVMKRSEISKDDLKQIWCIIRDDKHELVEVFDEDEGEVNDDS